MIKLLTNSNMKNIVKISILLFTLFLTGCTGTQHSISENDINNSVLSGKGTIVFISEDQKSLYILSHSSEPIGVIVIPENMDMDYSIGDIVEVEYKQETISTEDKSIDQNILVNITKGSETTPSHILSEYVDFTPDAIVIQQNDDEFEITDKTIINQVLEGISNIVMYEEGTILMGAGYSPVTITFLTQEQSVSFTESDYMTIDKNGEIIRLYDHNGETHLENLIFPLLEE